MCHSFWHHQSWGAWKKGLKDPLTHWSEKEAHQEIKSCLDSSHDYTKYRINPVCRWRWASPLLEVYRNALNPRILHAESRSPLYQCLNDHGNEIEEEECLYAHNMKSTGIPAYWNIICSWRFSSMGWYLFFERTSIAFTCQSVRNININENLALSQNLKYDVDWRDFVWFLCANLSISS